MTTRWVCIGSLPWFKVKQTDRIDLDTHETAPRSKRCKADVVPVDFASM